jgi:hypothetical protein
MLLSFVVLIQLEVEAQQSFEGTIRYQIRHSIQADQAGILPGFAEYHIKANNLVVQMTDQDNQLMARIVIQGDSGTLYMIDDSQKTAIKVQVKDNEIAGIGNVPEEFREEYEKALEQAAREDESKLFDLVKTGETELIAGYSCDKYIVKASGNDTFIGSEVWLTDEIKIELLETLRDKNNPLLFFMNEKGFPMKLIGKSKTGAQIQTLEMTAVKISQKVMDPAYFIVPDDYHITDMSGMIQRN